MSPAGGLHAEVLWRVEYDSGVDFLNRLVCRTIQATLERGLDRLPGYLERYREGRPELLRELP